MKKLMAIGEALIDFIPEQSGCLISEVKSFSPAVGGAPANVLGAFAKLGGGAQLLTQLGKDPFGDKIIKELTEFGIDVSLVRRTAHANTCLAFVSLKEDGNREFSFYRNPSADMLLQPEHIKEDWFLDCFCLHFCSVSLGEYPMGQAHKTAIGHALSHGAMVSFDPNVRFALWRDHEALRDRIWEFLPYAHILKLSDEELPFITGCDSMKEATEKLFVGNVELIIYTRGSKGARAYTRSTEAAVRGERVKALDTTGAGDAFIGSFLAMLYREGIGTKELPKLTEEQLARYLAVSNAYCAHSVQKRGAIVSYPEESEMEALLKQTGLWKE